ncbi:hypothetical protein Dimus_020235 [Dionaea muscipula]
MMAGAREIGVSPSIIGSFPRKEAELVEAMGRAATTFSRLADTAGEELPSTMAAIRLSSLEISDLTLELSELSQEASDGITKSAQAVKAAEVGICQIGSLARQCIICMPSFWFGFLSFALESEYFLVDLE